MALLLAGLPVTVPGGHRQPAVRLRSQCGRRRGARDPRRRDRARDRGRGVAIDDAGAVRAGQGRRGVRARRRPAGHHHRWRLHQSVAEGAIRRRRQPETAENVAEDYQVSRADQDPSRCARSNAPARPRPPASSPTRVVPVEIKGGKAAPVMVTTDELRAPTHTLDALAKLKPIVRNPGTRDGRQASGINDGAASHGSSLARSRPSPWPDARARVLGMASARCRRASWAWVRCRPPSS